MNSQLDVHPEDLLDRESAGLLSVDQRRRLEQHTSHCASCALLRAVPAAFASERASRPGDDALLARLIVRSMGTTELAPGSGFARGRLVRRVGPFAIAAAVLLAGTAAAASFWSVRQLFVQRAAPEAMVPPSSSTPAATGVTVVRPRVVPPAAPIHEVPSNPTTAAPTTAAPTAAAPVARESVRAPSLAREARPRQRATEELSAERLFAAANEARRGGDLGEAAKLYERLQQQYPGTREETTSRVLLGRLLLERGEDTPTALSLFLRYLAASPNGTLAEEARVGKALSLMRLGRRTEERQAWQDLLAAHPQTVHVRRAEQRLDELR